MRGRSLGQAVLHLLGDRCLGCIWGDGEAIYVFKASSATRIYIGIEASRVGYGFSYTDIYVLHVYTFPFSESMVRSVLVPIHELQKW